MRHETLCAILALLTSACGAGSDTTSQRAEISSCGGFPASQTSLTERAYCDAEVLRWRFDAATGSLELVDSRVQLNCCGQRHFELSRAGEVLVATETDLPTPDRARCKCMCVFDFRLTAEAITAGVVPFRLDRAIFEKGETEVIYQGALDLSEGFGEIVIDDQPIDPSLCAKTDR